MPRRASRRNGRTKRYWITSSARSSRDCGILRPSVLAVLTLMTSSNLCRLLNRQIGGFRAFENLVHVLCSPAVQVCEVGAVRHETTGVRKDRGSVHCREPVSGSDVRDPRRIACKDRILEYEYALNVPLGHRRKGAIKLIRGFHLQHEELKTERSGGRLHRTHEDRFAGIAWIQH